MADRSVVISLGECEWTITRARLGGFLRLQKLRESLQDAVRLGDNGAITDGMFQLIKVAIPDLTPKEFYNVPWYSAFAAYTQVEALNILPRATEFSIIQFGGGSGKPVPWDHTERSIIVWIHLIASSYGWSKEEIENLWPEEAVAFVQEIIADEQRDREFIHSLSTVAYKYQKSSKKSKYEPLKKPAWMQFRQPGQKKHLITKVHKKLLPVGNVIYPPGTEEEEKLH
jgi:hypothetical protein